MVLSGENAFDPMSSTGYNMKGITPPSGLNTLRKTLFTVKTMQYFSACGFEDTSCFKMQWHSRRKRLCVGRQRFNLFCSHHFTTLPSTRLSSVFTCCESFCLLGQVEPKRTHTHTLGSSRRLKYETNVGMKRSIKATLALSMDVSLE